MESIILELFGVWSELQFQMKEYTQVALQGDAAQKHAEAKNHADDQILKQYKKVVNRTYGVGFPMAFANLYNRTRTVRNKLAHFLRIDSIEGSEPNRIVTIVRTKGFEAHGDGIWMQHQYYERISEKEILRAVKAAKDARGLLFKIHQLSDEFKTHQPSDDEMWDFSWVPWWDGRWGPPPTTVEGFRAPVGRYRYHPESLEARAYRNEDENKWHWFTDDADEGGT